MQNFYMGYRNFTFPRLPDTLQMTDEKYLKALARPENSDTLQELGRHGRIITGSGAFAGAHAAADWRALCAEYEKGGPGALSLPGRPAVQALFEKLTLEKAPRQGLVSYSFVFWEVEPPKAQRTYTAKAGDCLWSAAAACGVTADSLFAANPGRIRWANELPAGLKLVVL
ncbi:MAG: LysM peptidoglycan-binding domain-containing protein [Oscillospiraceae bacterium]|jgi:LysM repeat protein|nr:LysM peptidoglycan-binding domain-containing protein [Oscillospiraceae bacterium]MDD3260438.1 LysM domain-containing protein [Oscillospiraceae bacterium]